MSDYTMHDLKQLTGLAGRTIRKYMQLGLIEKSAYRGVRTSYDDEQLVGLLAIKKMTAERLSIADMKATLRNMSFEERADYAGVSVDEAASEEPVPPLSPVVDMPPTAPPLVLVPPAPPAPPEPAPTAIAQPKAIPSPTAPSPPHEVPIALREAPAAVPVDERWTRTVLLPGMELLVKEDARAIVKTIAEEIRAKYGMA